MKDLKFCEIDIEYRKYIQEIEKKFEHSTEEKDNRKFLGIILSINDLDYVVPLSSPKEKHFKMKNSIDFLKINYKNQLIGVLNFNNMFPVPKGFYTILNINSVSDIKYRDLLQNELSWCNEITKKEKIYKNAEKLYKNITLKKEKSVFWSRCCDFSFLEEKSLEYVTLKEKLQDNKKINMVKINDLKEENNTTEKTLTVEKKVENSKSNEATRGRAIRSRSRSNGNER
jgi:protein AbiQ